MSLDAGIAFVGTGGSKMARALRSFRRVEPSLTVHIIFDTSTNSWRRNAEAWPAARFALEPNIRVKCIENTGYVNGAYNQALRWLDALGYSHACMFHDDTIFSPLPEHIGSISEWLAAIDTFPDLHEASGITLGFMEALVPSPNPGVWERSPDAWDQVDLESESLWRTLCPNGKSAMYFGSPGSDVGVAAAPDWFVKYFVTDKTCTIARLGPAGFIVPIALWKRLGGFDESHGIFYDMEYPVLVARAGLPSVKAVSSIPFIHLHNQSTAFGDPATGLWGHDLQSFIAHYGDEPGAVLTRAGYYERG